MSVNVSCEDARSALRRAHGVQLVAANQEGTSAAELSAGVYGFTSSPALASPLFATRRYRNFEVHRLADGPAVVGFVTADDAAKLATAADAPVDLQLLPDCDADASSIVAIAYDSIVHHRQYSVRNAGAIALRVTGGRTVLAGV